MVFFDNKEVNKKINELGKTLGKLISLQNQYNTSISQIRSEFAEAIKRSPEYEKEAQQASKKTSEFRNRANETFEEVKGILENSKLVESSIIQIRTELNLITEEIKGAFQDFKSENEEVNTSIVNLKSQIDNITEEITLFEETIEKHPDFESEIADLENFISKVRENDSKSNQLIKSITSRKIELETLYNEILGYEDENDEGETVEIKGLKQELEESLEGLDERTITLKKQFDELEKSTIDNVNNLLKVNSDKVNKQIEDWEIKYKNLNKEIEDLLPKALTAGLSHAFSDKKTDEEKLYLGHKKQFGYGILGMVAVSLIPFIISSYTLLNNEDLDIVINRVPKLVIAILPLYIPVLWLSISSSKKMNLSKRLIEEYSHKEVLSKTYEGLSKQVQNINENEISKELRTKLLQDFLQMYSENPGKLISDYNNSDHPIMELLENSNKLDRTISKLENVPGLQKVANLLEKKSEKKLVQATEAIERGLDKAIGLNGHAEVDENENVV